MKKTAISLIILCLAAASGGSRERWGVEERETIQKTLSFHGTAKTKEVQVDNIFGAIRVEGYGGQEVQLLVQKTVKARTQDKLQKARLEVTLEITEDENVVDLYVNGPFRCQNRKKGRGGYRDPGYQVHYDFELRVPHSTTLTLKTVTDGDIFVTDIRGDFDIQNVNGKIEMKGVAGSGRAHTVNGGVTVQFSQNPTADCSFKTVNGDIKIDFRDGLSADFRLKTFNGEAYSDFPFDYLPSQAATQSCEHGRFVYRSDRFMGVRIHRGGPEIRMDTLNGDLLINKREQGG